MSSTNKTKHYNLPQFVTSDKPSWLTDENAAMEAIDGAMYANSQAASQAATLAETAKTAADNALSVADGAVDMFNSLVAEGFTLSVQGSGTLSEYIMSQIALKDFTLFSFPRFHIGTLFQDLGNNLYYVGKHAGKAWNWLNDVQPVPGVSFQAHNVGTFIRNEKEPFFLNAYFNGTDTIFIVRRPGGFTTPPTLSLFQGALCQVTATTMVFNSIPN